MALKQNHINYRGVINMKNKGLYIVISLLIITNLVTIGYVERYCEVNQQQRTNVLLHDYLLQLTNEVSGEITKLRNIYPNVISKENKLFISKHSVFRNPHFRKLHSNIDDKHFHGFEFITNNQGKIISSGFYQP